MNEKLFLRDDEKHNNTICIAAGSKFTQEFLDLVAVRKLFFTLVIPALYLIELC